MQNQLVPGVGKSLGSRVCQRRGANGSYDGLDLITINPYFTHTPRAATSAARAQRKRERQADRRQQRRSGESNPDLRPAGTAVAHSGARPPRDHGDMAHMRYYWTRIPNGQLLGALRNARFTRTLRLKALTTSRLRHGPRVHRTTTSRETLYCVQLGAKKYRSFPRRYRSCTFG